LFGLIRRKTIIQANLASIWRFWVHKTHNSGTQYTFEKFDRDSNLTNCLLPGLEAQKVENHWSNGTQRKFNSLKMNLIKLLKNATGNVTWVKRVYYPELNQKKHGKKEYQGTVNNKLLFHCFHLFNISNTVEHYLHCLSYIRCLYIYWV